MFLRTIHFLIFCKQTAENVNKIFENLKKWHDLKRILALLTRGQKVLVLELYPFKKGHK